MLKIKDSVDEKDLEEYGFVLNDFNESDCFGNEIPQMKDCLYKSLGSGGRRGQEYYLFINKDRELRVYSSKPDGSGTDTNIHGTLFDLIKNGLVEKVES